MTPAELMLRRYAAQGLGVTMKGTQDWLTVADGTV